MIRDKYNIIPLFMAGVLHALIVTSLLVVFDISSEAHPAVPLAITATLVQEADIPQIVTSEPEPPPVDTAEQDRAAAEELKRQEDLRAEQQRIRQEKAADERRQQQEAEERKRREDAERERRLQEAERKRLEDIERQRAENERLRQEAEQAERERLHLAALNEEQNRLDAINSGAAARYQFAIRQKIQRNWIPPASAGPGLECIINLRQSQSGEVLSATIGDCNGDDAVQRSILAAVRKATPLPAPENRYLFDQDLIIVFKPEQ